MNLDLSKLLEPQREHAVKLLNSLYVNGVAADLSDTGTGKTYSACWIALQMRVPVLILCPKIMIRTWENTLKYFGIKGSVINYDKMIRGTTPYMRYVVDIPTKSEHYDFKMPTNSLVIMDECHKCKALYSKNALLMKALKDHKYKMLLMSATAATNPLEMRSFGYVTGLHSYTTFPSWVKSMGAFINQSGHYEIDSECNEVVKKMSEIHNVLFNELKVAGRMCREMFGKIFPKNTVNVDPINMGNNTSKIESVYLNMEAELARLEERASNYSSHHFAVMMRARRKVELLKVPTMIEYAVDLYEQNISPVLFVNFNETVSAIKERLMSINGLSKKIGYIIGNQTEKQRSRDVEMFQSDEKRIMLVNLRAGNAGISLHDLNGKFPRYSIISPSFSAIDIKQSMGRIHRAEAKTPTVQNIMFAAKTVEERACVRVSSKLTNLSMLNDNDISPDFYIR